MGVVLIELENSKDADIIVSHARTFARLTILMSGRSRYTRYSAFPIVAIARRCTGPVEYCTSTIRRINWTTHTICRLYSQTQFYGTQTRNSIAIQYSLY